MYLGKKASSHKFVLFSGKLKYIMVFPCSSVGKESACNTGDMGSIPESGRSPEKEMAAHSSILAWRIPWTEESGRYSVHGVARIGHDLVTKPPPALKCVIFLDFQMASNLSMPREFLECIFMPKPLTVWIRINWKILKEVGIPDHLTCLLRNVYAGQEATGQDMHNRLVPNRKRSPSRLYIVILFI